MSPARRSSAGGAAPRGAPADTAHLVRGRRLQEVPVSREQGRRMLAQARTHLATARQVARQDPEGAYALAYDAARKALTGLLEAHGLRPTTRGGHVVVHDAALALVGAADAATVRPFDRLRRRRHQAEYPSTDAPRVTAEDVDEDAVRVEAILAMVARRLDVG